MNLIGFVFSILLLLTYSFCIHFEKQTFTQRLKTSYLGHLHANREILNTYARERYKKFPRNRPKPTQNDGEKVAIQESTVPPPPKINPLSARINLYSLLQSGKEENRLLYECTVKLLQEFYNVSEGFIDHLLAAAKKESRLEKLDFKDYDQQTLYYKMMKATDTSVLDYLCIEEGQESICLYEAHPRLIALFFGAKAAEKIYAELHKKGASTLTEEAVARICQEVHAPIYQPEIFNLVSFKKPKQEAETIQIVVGDSDTAITLRKNLYLGTKG